MAHYYATYPTVNAVPNTSDEGDAATETVSEFDKHRETLLSDDAEEGWASELRRYLKTVERSVKRTLISSNGGRTMLILGPVVFEEVTITKSAWGPGLCDVAAWNAAQIEEVGLLDYEQMLVDEGDFEKWEMPSLDMDWD
ncbi:hypothetical protein M413DRAFT_33043 [Hebeloma cylindrosporum]|uniref:Uncharacterized protein n=1 Tax=Hebeloma cylindrosporum TaxID=76867 RepID=A0A0C2X9P8_HEBCY|nr:hypothetical protein M413DRAFT_33043 [Hebeloma cylindrosporum h7]